MIRRSSEKQSVTKPSPFNGVGEITVRSLLNGPEEMENKGRVFGHTTVYPGSKIGLHTHKGDAETYYILSGQAVHQGIPGGNRQIGKETPKKGNGQGFLADGDDIFRIAILSNFQMGRFGEPAAGGRFGGAGCGCRGS